MPKTPLPTKCPRCESDNTIHLETVETSTCLNCDLDWWWSEDDNEIVTSGASQVEEAG